MVMKLLIYHNIDSWAHNSESGDMNTGPNIKSNTPRSANWKAVYVTLVKKWKMVVLHNSFCDNKLSSYYNCLKMNDFTLVQN